ITKIILLPVSLWCQKNSIKMVQLTPEINKIKIKYFGDKDTINEQQVALYKKEHYHPLLSIIPLAIQLIILIGLIGVIYNITTANPELIIGILPYEQGGLTLLLPIIAGLSALILGFAQNKINPLQKEQTRAGQMSTNGLSIAISLVLGIFVPMGVGFYWICSNLSSILIQVLCNIIINPKKYVDYKALADTKKELAELQNLGGSKKWYRKDENSKREKADYKKFFSIANKHLVFYSEGSGFYKYFESVINELLKRSNIIIHYVTSDPNDQIFNIAKNQPRIKPYYIGEKRLITLMMKMDSDIVVMTMPDLQNYHIKRSYVRKDTEYIYMFHWVTSVHMVVRTHALDNFDTLLCVGSHQISEIREMEKIYSLSSKNLIECGYGLIEKEIEEYNLTDKKKHEIPEILIAPSYQEDNIMDSCIDEIVETIISNGWKAIVRPHPQYIRRTPEKISLFEARHKQKLDEGQLILQTDFSSNKTVFEADVLITDWSTIAFEYSFSTKKPTLFINTKMKVINPEYRKLSALPKDILWRNEIGRSLEKDELENVCDVIKEFLNCTDTYREKISELLDLSIYNLGSSGKAGADYIIHKLSEKQNQRRVN
ncbi:MAG: YidC/Oxa1 family membrane protein insertase, partial [Fibrobacter sp.]|nr:YidC/Oxa1 family membrane protein insertase [Fibrobacter sp.]